MSKKKYDPLSYEPEETRAFGRKIATRIEDWHFRLSGKDTAVITHGNLSITIEADKAVLKVLLHWLV